MKRLIVSAMLLALAWDMARGAEYFVRVDGNDASNGLSWAAAKATVRGAVTNAVDGDIVSISNGTHMVTCGGIAVDYAVTIRGVNGPEVTILDAGNVSPRRIFIVNAPAARIEGLTATRANWSTFSNAGGALVIKAGVVTNCIIKANRSYNNGGGVYVNGGTLIDSIVQGNDSGSTGPGGVKIDAGAVLNCTITNNITGWNSNSGGGIHVAGGMVSNCLIRANTCGIPGSPDARGSGAYQTGGLIVNCEIVANLSHASGGGIYQAGGILRNTLLRGNYAFEGGGGLYLTAGAVQNCTVVGNFSERAVGSGIRMMGGAVSNTIAYFNVGGNLSQSGGLVEYSCVTPLPAAGAGNIDTDPMFVDEEAGNYRLSLLSPCADSGTNQTWMGDTVDLDGQPRVGNAVVDMGAYERLPASGGPLQCGFHATPVSGVVSQEVAFAGLVAGDDVSGIIYTWDFGDGTVVDGAGLAAPVHTYGTGYFTVTLTVTNGSFETASRTRTQYIKIRPEIVHVSGSGLNLAPYETWERAASSVDDAVFVGASTVLISNGTYAVKGYGGYGIVINSAMTIRGVNGPDVTILDAGNVNPRRVFFIDSPGARIEGLTGRRSLWKHNTSTGGGNVLINAGVVSNCIVTSSGSYRRGAVYVNGGTLTDSVVHGNDSGSAGPGGIQIDAGAVLNCTITNNVTGWNGVNAGGIYVTGGLASNCLVRANQVSQATKSVASSRGGGVYQTGGLVVNCEVTDNKSHSVASTAGGGGVYLGGGILRNVLIARNYAFMNGGGLYLTAGAAQNCTVASNTTAGAGGGVWMSGGSVSNSIAYFNAPENLSQSGGAIEYSCVEPPPAAGDGNIDADPAFVDAASGNWRLADNSPCLGKGRNQGWMETATDLDGNPRIRGIVVDMGAYELLPPRGTLILLR